MTSPTIVTAPTPYQFGTGDGATTQFPLVKDATSFIGTPAIYRNDWKGNQLLYVTARTNSIRNNTMVGAVAGSPGTLPTNWSIGGLNGLSMSIVAVGTDSGIGYLDVRLFGTANATALTAVYPETATGVAASNGQVWTHSPYLKLVAGSFSGVNLFAVGVDENNSGGSFLTGSMTKVLASVTSSLTRFSHTRTLSNASMAAVRPYVYITYTSGAVIDITLRIGMPQLELGAFATPVIATSGAAVTVTDYTLTSNGVVSLASPPLVGAALSWTGSFTYVPATPVVSFASSTIISQFANSPTIVQLIENMGQYIRQDTNFQAFYDFIWNVNTAQGFGLDIWGRIVDVKRNLQINAPVVNFGFQDGLKDYAPFGSAPFYNGPPATSTYTLSDDAYRTLILAKALANISATTSQALNQLLKNLFPNRGRCYVNDMGGMAMRYTFEFYLQPYEVAIITSSGVLPHGAGVNMSVLQVALPYIFGFAEMGTHDAAPFGQGAFFSP